ncbi:MAG: hypothetical protein FJ267_17135, partial [Planctomycetes bacterium]|nr:hypothetical protein [Planctomycetota bacterium]
MADRPIVSRTNLLNWIFLSICKKEGRFEALCEDGPLSNFNAKGREVSVFTSLFDCERRSFVRLLIVLITFSFASYRVEAQPSGGDPYSNSPARQGVRLSPKSRSQGISRTSFSDDEQPTRVGRS